MLYDVMFRIKTEFINRFDHLEGITLNQISPIFIDNGYEIDDIDIALVEDEEEL